jgi:A/G-specific adenine glycosylase
MSRGDRSSLSNAAEALQPLASSPASFSRAEITLIRLSLLDWYVANYRKLPWRQTPRYRGDGQYVAPPTPESPSSAGSPYAVWVSEVMSQQTRIVVVIEYWTRWMVAFPNVAALAAAPLERVNEMWAGLGYYRRAKLLHEGAKQIVSDFGGKLPCTVHQLRQIRGIGAYTAGAVCSIAFNAPGCPAVDGNVARVLARALPRILPNTEPWSTPGAKARVYDELATAFVDDIECAGDMNQGLWPEVLATAGSCVLDVLAVACPCLV